MEGGKEVRLSLAGRRPVNHHADHVYVQILFTTLTWSCIYYQLRFFFTLLCNLLDILITHSNQARSHVFFFFTERCHPTMRRTKRGRKAQVSREGGKVQWGGRGGGILQVVLRLHFERFKGRMIEIENRQQKRNVDISQNFGTSNLPFMPTETTYVRIFKFENDSRRHTLKGRNKKKIVHLIIHQVWCYHMIFQ